MGCATDNDSQETDATSRMYLMCEVTRNSENDNQHNGLQYSLATTHTMASTYVYRPMVGLVTYS